MVKKTINVIDTSLAKRIHGEKNKFGIWSTIIFHFFILLVGSINFRVFPARTAVYTLVTPDFRTNILRPVYGLRTAIAFARIHVQTFYRLRYSLDIFIRFFDSFVLNETYMLCVYIYIYIYI